MCEVLDSNSIVENQLNKILEELEAYLNADVLIICSPMLHGVDSEVRDLIDKRIKKRKKLFVILETEGGYIGTVQRIADTFRKHYKIVEFLVPNFA
ncbi:MAG: hypothetical protein ACE5GM_11260, partial [bacterium]